MIHVLLEPLRHTPKGLKIDFPLNEGHRIITQEIASTGLDACIYVPDSAVSRSAWTPEITQLRQSEHLHSDIRLVCETSEYRDRHANQAIGTEEAKIDICP